MTTIFRMLIFVLLGTQVDFQTVFAFLGVGLSIVVIQMLVARPVTVLTSVLPDRRARWNRREVLFMMWVRETGVIPAALAGTLLAHHVQNANIISAVTFMAILITILVQATSTGWVAKKLGLALISQEHEL